MRRNYCEQIIVITQFMVYCACPLTLLVHELVVIAVHIRTSLCLAMAFSINLQFSRELLSDCPMIDQ